MFLIFTRLKIKHIRIFSLLANEKRWPIFKCCLLENPQKADTFLHELNRIILYLIKTLKPLLTYQIWPWCWGITKDAIFPLSIHYRHTSNIAEGASGFKRHLLWNDKIRHLMYWSDTIWFLLLAFTIIISISIVRFFYSAKQTIFLLIIWLNCSFWT